MTYGGALRALHLLESPKLDDFITSYPVSGGYQPAQKWLKDRKGSALGYEDILHYQRIIVALTETGRIMAEIDDVKFV